MEKKLKIGVIGCGYWGPNLVRNFSALSNCEVTLVAEKKAGRREYIKNEFPSVKTTEDYKHVINDHEIQAVCIATPVRTHASMAIEALNAGKHVFIEKPMASSVEDAESVLEAAERNHRKIAVGHVFQFSPAVRAIKRLIDSGMIGKIYHIESNRINLGPPETDVNVIWDLGPHDFSIILYLLGEYPSDVFSMNSSFPYGYTQSNEIINNSDIQLKFSSGTTAHIHLSWLSANKVRLMQIFGSEGTIVYDEMLALDGKVKLYGKGIDNRVNANSNDNEKLIYTYGDISVIKLEQHEPLRMECEHFVNAVLKDTSMINDGLSGLAVVKLLVNSEKNSILNNV